MNRILFLILCMIIGIAQGFAETPAEIFRGNELLTDLFVNPLGIPNVAEDTNAAAVETKIQNSGLEYKKMSLGPLGEVFCIFPSDMKIGNTEIASLAIAVNKDYSMLAYQSKAAGDYKDMCRILDSALIKYAEKADKNVSGNGTFTIYMLSEQWGVAIGSDSIRKTSMAYLLDVKNLQNFIGLGNFIQ